MPDHHGRHHRSSNRDKTPAHKHSDRCGCLPVSSSKHKHRHASSSPTARPADRGAFELATMRPASVAVPTPSHPTPRNPRDSEWVAITRSDGTKEWSTPRPADRYHDPQPWLDKHWAKQDAAARERTMQLMLGGRPPMQTPPRQAVPVAQQRQQQLSGIVHDANVGTGAVMNRPPPDESSWHPNPAYYPPSVRDALELPGPSSSRGSSRYPAASSSQDPYGTYGKHPPQEAGSSQIHHADSRPINEAGGDPIHQLPQYPQYPQYPYLR